MSNPVSKRNKEIIRLYGAGWSLVKLSEEYELSVERVRRILENNGVTLRKVGRPRSKT